MSLEVQELCFSYEKPLLKNISFSLKEGEFVGILGPNGCGKSTLIKNILKILKPQSGRVCYKGKDLKHYSHKDLSKLISFVPQKSGLNMPFLVEDLLYMGRFSHMKSVFCGYDKQDQAMVTQIAQLLRLEKFLKRLALSLSGGEFQRVLLARALVGMPEVLILDEPTSALDVNHAIDMMQICEHYVSMKRLSVLVVLHDLNLAGLFCHRVILMKEGEIRYIGSVKEVFTPEILKEIYDFSCDVIDYDGHPFVLIKK